MRTFKELQDSVLAWIGDSGDTGLLLTVTKDALNQAQREFLQENRFDFMLYPKVETLSVEASRTQYSLHPLFGKMLWCYNHDQRLWMQPIPTRAQFELNESPSGDSVSGWSQYMLTGLSPVKRQPATTGALTLTTTGGTEAAAATVTVYGTDADGEEISETLGGGGSWATDTSTLSFATITRVVKDYTTYTRTLTLTDASLNTLLVLKTTEDAKQYRQFELLRTPNTAGTIKYRFYMKPRPMVGDYDHCMVPEEFDNILVYRALLATTGFGRPTEQERDYWSTQLTKLENNCRATYMQMQGAGARGDYINYNERY